LQLSSSPARDPNSRTNIDDLALELVADVRQRFRAYQTELGVQEWAHFYTGELPRFVSCFEPMISALVCTHLENGYVNNQLCPAVFSCITAVVDKTTFDTTRGPDYPARPQMPATYPWRVSELFGNEQFRQALKDAIFHSIEARQTAIEESHGPEEATSNRGRRPNNRRRDAIRSAITKHGPEWRDHLSEVFIELDSNDVPLGDFQGRDVDLGDGQSTRVSKWDDLDFAHGEQRNKIIDALRKYAA
jgi:hypothetical protein